MVDPAEFLSSMTCFLARLLQMLRKFLSMMLCSVNSKPSDRRRHPFQDHELILKKAARRRPARIAIPKPLASTAAAAAFEDWQDDGDAVKEVQDESGDYCVASRRGQRHKMEDDYGVISNIHGDSKQAFFGVFDGHGGRAAVDFVSEKLGKNIVTALDEMEEEGGEREANGRVEMAIRAGYSTTDWEFLSQGLCGGTCAATVLVKDGEMHVANVGDCRVVMSHRGVANALTDDHRAAREEERNRIQNNGGFMTCHNGTWRVQDTLAVSRSFGDLSLKEWIISEPDTKNIHLTPDCEFLILASDGLWDKVTNQEAVDVVSQRRSLLESCKLLIELSCRRGNRDDITVMVIQLKSFVQLNR